MDNSTRSILTSTTIFSHGEKVDDALRREIAMIFKTDRSFKIKDLNVYISGNQFKNLKFRLQFYDLSTDEPILIPVSPAACLLARWFIKITILCHGLSEFFQTEVFG